MNADPLVAIGVVRYDVLTNCPHCGKRLRLNEPPYSDYNTSYSIDRNMLRETIFCSGPLPASWTGLQIECMCCGCNKQFMISQLTI